MNPKNWGSLGHGPLVLGAWLTTRNTLLPTCYPAEFDRSKRCERSKGMRLKIYPPPYASRPSRSRKVIETDTDRSATYDFLLTFHSNHGPISYTVSEINGDFSRKSQFSHPRIFSATAEGFPLELFIVSRVERIRMMELPGRWRSLTISLAVWIQYANVTDRQTDGQMDRHRAIDRPRLRIASYGKKNYQLHLTCVSTLPCKVMRVKIVTKHNTISRYC